jgi:glycosyltransferase involved in cell wall biosynthesis
MLDQLLNDPDSLSEMGHKGKSLVTEQLSWENEQDLYLNIYADLLS